MYAVELLLCAVSLQHSSAIFALHDLTSGCLDQFEKVINQELTSSQFNEGLPPPPTGMTPEKNQNQLQILGTVYPVSFSLTFIRSYLIAVSSFGSNCPDNKESQIDHFDCYQIMSPSIVLNGEQEDSILPNLNSMRPASLLSV